MKKLLIGLLSMGCITSFAGELCPNSISYYQNSYTNQGKPALKNESYVAKVFIDINNENKAHSVTLVPLNELVAKRLREISRLKVTDTCLLGYTAYIGGEISMYVNSIKP